MAHVDQVVSCHAEVDTVTALVRAGGRLLAVERIHSPVVWLLCQLVHWTSLAHALVLDAILQRCVHATQAGNLVPLDLQASRQVSLSLPVSEPVNPNAAVV